MSNVRVESGVDDVRIQLQVTLREPTLEQLVADGSAGLRFLWRCGATFNSGVAEPLSKRRVSGRTQYEISIPQEEVSREVRVDARIVAAQPIETYSNPAQHPLYGRASFSIQTGDVLGYGGYFAFAPGKSYDPLSPPFASCFKFRVSDRVRSGIVVNAQPDDEVEVLFSRSVYDSFRGLAGRPDLQVATVVLPALTEVLWLVRTARESEEPSELSGTPWFRTIARMADEVGGDKQPIEQAQLILEDPLHQCFATQLSVEEEQ